VFKFVAFFAYLYYVSMKGSYQTHGGNFITSHRMPVSREISRTVLWVCGVSSWLRTRSLTRSTFSSVQHLVICLYLWVCWLCQCLWTFSAAC